MSLLTWTWSDLVLKVSISTVNNNFGALLKFFSYQESLGLVFFLNMYFFKCIKRSIAADSVNPCAVCAICPGNYLCMVITIATSQVDNVMQITAAAGMGDVNASMYLHPWSSTFCSDFSFLSSKTC